MRSGEIGRRCSMLWALALVVGTTTASRADIWHVDDDSPPGGDGTTWATAFTNLQDALNSAQSGDQVWVATGVYYPDRDEANPSPGTGDPTATFNLSSGVGIYGGFLGTAHPNGGETSLDQRDPLAHWTYLTSTSHLNSDTYHIVTATFTDDTAILDGFRIMGGSAGDAPNPVGGGVLLDGADPQIIGCVFIRNGAQRGGAVGVITNLPNTTEARLINCSFFDNGASDFGGAIHTGTRYVECINCIFDTNGAGGGGAVSNPGGFNSGSAILTNCTFVGNVATGGSGGAIYDDAFGGGSTLTNCVVWNNVPDQIFAGMAGGTSVTYSYVEGGWPGTGNIDDEDPLLCDADGPDNALGTLDDNLRLLDQSPCVDAGNDVSVPLEVTEDFDGLARFFDSGSGSVGSSVDMGAHENHHVTLCPWDIAGPGGSDPDGNVGIDDQLQMFGTWGSCPGCAADYDCDLIVGITDFLALYGHWGPCPTPPGPCDEGYVPGPGDPIPELYCNTTYRNLVLGRLVPIQVPVLCTALNLLGQPERCAAIDDNTYVQIDHPPQPTMKVFIDDGGPALLLRFDPEILPENPQPALIASLETQGPAPGNSVVVGFLQDQVIAVFAEIFETIEYLQLAQEVVESIETVTDPCQLRTSLTHYGEMFNFSDPGKVGFCAIECIAFVDSIVEPFGFGSAGAAANIVRMFFYYACPIICDDFAFGLTAGQRSDVRSAILVVRDQVACP